MQVKFVYIVILRWYRKINYFIALHSFIKRNVDLLNLEQSTLVIMSYKFVIDSFHDTLPFYYFLVSHKQRIDDVYVIIGFTAFVLCN